MFGVNNLFLNIILIHLGVYIFFALGLNRKQGHRWIVGALCGFSVIVCMTFPFSMFPGYIYDFRIIPLLISFLYGSIASGCAVTLILFVYRYLIGGEGFLASIIVYSIISLIVIFAIRQYNLLSARKKYSFGVALAFVSALTSSLVSLVQLGTAADIETVEFFIYYCILNALIMWMTVYVIEMMRENMRMRTELQRTEKLLVMGELAATIAHEIRNPMTVAKGFTQLMKQRAQDEATLRYTGLVIEELDRAETILSDYLSYAKPQLDRVGTINIKEQLNYVVNMMSPFAESRGTKIECHVEDAIYIVGDAKKLCQVLVNMIKNAAEAMEGEGKITINSYSSHGNAVIEVMDNGIGMSDEQMKRLGKPFVSTKDRGTGLGMMVSFRIIQAFHGKIDVTSKIGGGTTFTIKIPLAVMNLTESLPYRTPL